MLAYNKFVICTYINPNFFYFKVEFLFIDEFCSKMKKMNVCSTFWLSFRNFKGINLVELFHFMLCNTLCPKLLNSQSTFWESNFILGMQKQLFGLDPKQLFTTEVHLLNNVQKVLSSAKRSWISKTSIGNLEVLDISLNWFLYKGANLEMSENNIFFLRCCFFFGKEEKNP